MGYRVVIRKRGYTITYSKSLEKSLMQKPLEHKQGDSFNQIIQISPVFSDGYFREWEVTSQIRLIRGATKIADLEAQWIDPNTTHFLNLKAIDTSSWPFGKASLDIQFKRISDGNIISSETIYVVITKDMTY